MEENNEEVVLEEKKSKKPLIIGLLVLAVVAIAVGACFALGVFGGDKKEEKKEEPKKKDEGVVVNIDTTRLTGVTAEDFDGVYKAGNNVIKIVKIADDEVWGPSIFVYYNLGNSTGATSFKFEDDYLTDDSSFSKQRILVLYKEGLGLIEREAYDKDGNYVELNLEKEKATPYKRTAGYTKEDMFKDFYGDTSQLESKYTGHYQAADGSGAEIYTFIDKDGDVQITYNIGNTFGSTYGKPDADGKVVTDSRTEPITFTFDENTLVITDENTSEDFDNLSGTFTKVGQLTIDDVINHITVSF